MNDVEKKFIFCTDFLGGEQSGFIPLAPIFLCFMDFSWRRFFMDFSWRRFFCVRTRTKWAKCSTRFLKLCTCLFVFWVEQRERVRERWWERERGWDTSNRFCCLFCYGFDGDSEGWERMRERRHIKPILLFVLLWVWWGQWGMRGGLTEERKIRRNQMRGELRF